MSEQESRSEGRGDSRGQPCYCFLDVVTGNIRNHYSPLPLPACPLSKYRRKRREVTTMIIAVLSGLSLVVAPTYGANENSSAARALSFSPQPSEKEIMGAKVFDEPLIPIGGQPSQDENTALAAALLQYGQRSSPDDFSSLTAFLEKFPSSKTFAPMISF